MFNICKFHCPIQFTIENFALLFLCFYSIVVYCYIHRQLLGREKLDSYLSFALGVPLEEDGRLQDIDDAKYVLTLDYTVKVSTVPSYL